VHSYYYLIYYSLDQSPLWIDHVGYFKRTISPFVDWSYCNCKRKKKKSALEYIKEAPKHNKGGYNHPVEEVNPASEETLHTFQSCINKEASASLRHTKLTCSFVRQVLELQLEKKEREWIIYGRGSSALVQEISWHCIGYL
jgi:hypothetical protein